jgi:hypothetical protein
MAGAMEYRKVNEKHSAGEIDSATYSAVIQGLARIAFPDDKDALSKFLKLHAEELSEKLRKDYEREQRRTALAGYEGTGIGDGIAWAGAVVGGGVGYSNNNNDAKVDGVSSGSAADTVVGKQFANLVTKDNIDTLIKKYGLTFDQAATMLARGGN